MLICHMRTQACLPFAPSAALQALVQQSAAQLQERRWADAASRRRLMALTNAWRCSMRPVYGEDLLGAVHVDLPVHHVNRIKERVRPLRQKFTSSGPPGDLWTVPGICFNISLAGERDIEKSSF